jgi:hypothetical protein
MKFLRCRCSKVRDRVQGARCPRFGSVLWTLTWVGKLSPGLFSKTNSATRFIIDCPENAGGPELIFADHLAEPPPSTSKP